MAIPHIVATDLTHYTWNAASEAAGHPVANLADYDFSKTWASSTNADDQNCTTDLGTARTFNSVCMVGHNMSTLGGSGAQLIAADDTNLTVNPVVLKNTWADDKDLFFQFSPVTKRYVGFLFGTGLGLAPKIGKIFFDTSLDFTTPYNWGYKRDNAEYVTTEKTSLSGVTRTSQTYAGRKVWELSWTNSLDNTFDAAFKTFIQTVRGKLFPFFFVDVDGITIRYLQLAADYVPMTGRRFNINNIESLVMKTQQATY